MANLPVPHQIPRPLLASRRVRNGLLPSHLTASYIARACNYVTAHCRKVVFQKPNEFLLPVGGGSITPWRWLCRTGEASTTPGSLKLVAIGIGMPPTDWDFTVDDGATTTTSDARVVTGDDIDADDIALMISEVDVDPDTEYECRLRINAGATNKPLMAMTVVETHEPSVSTSDSITIDQRAHHHKGPIYDASAQELVEVPHKLWKHNGAQLLAIAQDRTTTPWTNTGNTWTNMLESSASTTVSSSTPGFNLRTTFLNPYHSTSIAARLGVYADGGGLSAGDVRIADSGGVITTLSNFANGGEWKKANFSLTGGSDHKIDIQFRGGTTNTIDVEAVSIYLYET